MGYDKNNIFAQILEGKVPVNKIYEDDRILAFEDANPDAEVHILVIPKGAYSSYEDFITKASIEECSHFFSSVYSIAMKLDLKKGFRLVINNGKLQHVSHLHVHILGGRIFDGKK